MLASVIFRFRCAFALAMIVVTAMALLPPAELPVTLTLWDKANHALAYFFLAWLGDRSFPTSRRAPLLVFFSLFIYGMAIEALQSQIPSRQASWLDMLANGTGLMLYGFARGLVVKHHD